MNMVQFVLLVGSLTLEFCAHGVWGRVCNKLDYWGPNNARVVCRQLGFSEQGNLSPSTVVLGI